jgi:hypothetical protein
MDKVTYDNATNTLWIELEGKKPYGIVITPYNLLDKVKIDENNHNAINYGSISSLSDTKEKIQAHPSFKRNADLTLDKVHDSKMNDKVFELENLINKMIIDFEKENELEKIKVFSHFPQSPFERVQPKCYLVRVIG